MSLSDVPGCASHFVERRRAFSGTYTTLILVAWALSLAWTIWLVVVAWRVRDSDASHIPLEMHS